MSADVFPSLEAVKDKFLTSVQPGSASKGGLEADMLELIEVVSEFGSLARVPPGLVYSVRKPENPANASETFCYCCQKLEHLQAKLTALVFSFMHECTDLAQQVLTLLTQLVVDGKGSSYHFNVHAFRDYVSGILVEVDEGRYGKIISKINTLDRFADQLYWRRFQPVGTDKLQYSLTLCAKWVDVESSYADWTTFDDILVLYVRETDDHCFDVAAKGLLSREKAVDCSGVLDQLKRRLSAMIDIHKPAEELLFQSAVQRRLFEVVAIERPRLLLEHKNQGIFERNCAAVANMTPREWNLSGGMLVPEMMDLPWSNIVQRSLMLREAGDHLLLLQFAMCPLDMAWQCRCAVESISTFIQVSRTTVEAQNSDEHGSEKGPVFLSFDDMAMVLIPVVAVVVPSNAVAIADFIERFRVRMSSVLMSALQLFQSAVQYLVSDKNK